MSLMSTLSLCGASFAAGYLACHMFHDTVTSTLTSKLLNKDAKTNKPEAKTKSIEIVTPAAAKGAGSAAEREQMYPKLPASVPRFVVLVDMDNTLADLDGALKSAFLLAYPGKAHLWVDNRRDFEFAGELDKLVRPLMSQEGFFEHLQPLPRAIESIQALTQHADVYFCTSPIREDHLLDRRCVGEKQKWLEKHFGPSLARRIVATKYKNIVGSATMTTVLIDDKPYPENDSPIKPSWIHIVFSQSYNQHVAGKTRIAEWSPETAIAAVTQSRAAHNNLLALVQQHD